MNAYERQVLRDWLHEDQRKLNLATCLTKQLSGRLSKVAKLAAGQETLAKGMDKLRDVTRHALLQVLSQAATAKQMHQVEQVAHTFGSHVTTASDLRMLPLEVKDQISHTLTKKHTARLTTEGATAGFATSLFELVPGLQTLVLPTIIADLTATVFFMAQSAVQIGYSYGYSMETEEDITHFLFALSPYDLDDNIIEAKVALHMSIKKGTMLPIAQLANHEALRPLIDRIATRIATTFMEQRVSLLIPVAGALLQGTLNAAFAKSSYKSAKRYFQRQHFMERYGEDYLQQCLEETTSPAYQTL